MISIFLCARKVTAPVIEYYRVAADQRRFDTDAEFHAHLLSEMDKANKPGAETDAVFVDSQVLPYEGKPELKTVKAENAAVAAAQAEAQRRSIIEAKRKVLDLKAAQAEAEKDKPKGKAK